MAWITDRRSQWRGKLTVSHKPSEMIFPPLRKKQWSLKQTAIVLDSAWRHAATALRCAWRCHCFPEQFLEWEPVRMPLEPAGSCCVWGPVPEVGFLCGLRGWLRICIQGQKGRNGEIKWDIFHLVFCVREKKAFAVGYSYKIRRDKDELLKHLFTQVHAEFSEGQTYPLN